MILRTDRMILRRAQAGDLPDLHAVFSDPRAMRYWTRPAHTTRAETQVTLDALMAADGQEGDEFVLEHAGHVIGKAGMWRVPEVGFILHPDHWGQGLMIEALTAVIAHLFSAHDMPALTAEADPRNAGSLNVLRRLGFAVTGHAARTMQWGEEWCDSTYLALPRATWDQSAR